MALYQIGKADEAQAAYGEAMKLSRKAFPNAANGLKSIGFSWIDWIDIDLLRREAEGLPRSKSNSNEPGAEAANN